MGIPVVIMEPLKSGRLSNPPDEILKLHEKFKPLSPSQQALKYVLSLPNVMTVLSEMNDIRQIDENIEMASFIDENSLTDEDKISIRTQEKF